MSQSLKDKQRFRNMCSGERMAKQRDYAKFGTLQTTGFGQSIDCLWEWWAVAVCRANIPPFPLTLQLFSLTLQLPEVMSVLQVFKAPDISRRQLWEG